VEQTVSFCSLLKNSFIFNIGLAKCYSLSVLAQTGFHADVSVEITLCASNARKAGDAAHG
jgi:hypothetical protein